MNLYEPDRRATRGDHVDDLLTDFFRAEVPAEIRDLPDVAPRRAWPTVARGPASDRDSAPASRRAVPAGMVAATAVAVAAAACVFYVGALWRQPAGDAVAARSIGDTVPEIDGQNTVAPARPIPAIDEEQELSERIRRTERRAANPAPVNDPTRAVMASSLGVDGGLLAAAVRGAVRYSTSEDVAPVDRRTYTTKHGRVEQRTSRRTTNVSYYEPASGSEVQFAVPELVIEILAANDGGT